MKYAIVIERAKKNYSAYVPDLPGCIATGTTLDEAQRMIREAIEFHLEGMLLHGETIPDAATRCCEVEIDVAQIVASLPPAPVTS